MRGISQLKKEVVEQRYSTKLLDMNGLHRNEETEEIEGVENVISDNVKEFLKKKIVKHANS